MATLEEILKAAEPAYDDVSGGACELLNIYNGTANNPQADPLAWFLVREIESAYEAAEDPDDPDNNETRFRAVVSGLREAAEEIKEVAEWLENLP